MGPSATELRCLRCDAVIQPATARATGGVCRPCARGASYINCAACGRRVMITARSVENQTLCLRCLGEAERVRPTGIDAFVGTRTSSPLLVRLFKLDESLRCERRDGWIGLNLIDPPRRESDVAPLNSIAFASTGGDDVTFSLVLAADGEFSDSSPVVLTVPRAIGTVWDVNFIVGETLHDFLCLGCQSGYHPLETLPYSWDEAVEELTSPGEHQDEKQLETLRSMRAELGLQPWPDIHERLKGLQATARFVLRFEPLSSFRSRLRALRALLNRRPDPT